VSPPATTDDSIRVGVAGSVGLVVNLGRWEETDEDKGTVRGYCLLRMLLAHSIEKKEDIQFSWVDEKTFKIRIKWPNLSVLMTGLDEFGDEFGEPEELHDDMEENTDELRSSDGNIWSEGLCRFENPMNKMKYIPKLFALTHAQTNRKGFLLQVRFTESSEDDQQAEDENDEPFVPPTIEMLEATIQSN